MASTPSSSSSSTASAHRFMQALGISANLPQSFTHTDAYSDLVRPLIKVDGVEGGRVCCFLAVKPPFCNPYGSLHGGTVAAVAEMVGMACVRTVMEKEVFLGEMATSYLSAARVNDELEVVGLILRQGRNVAVTSVEFRMKETKKLVYSARATFYNLPVATL